MLNNREIKMLDIFSSGEEVSIKKLKEKFDISERMVRYDIEKIYQIRKASFTCFSTIRNALSKKNEIFFIVKFLIYLLEDKILF